MRNNTDNTDRDAALDILLAEAAPPTPLADAADRDVFAQMVADARGPGDRRAGRHTARVAGLALAGTLAIGGGGLAAAASLGWEPWAENPDGAYFYSLPSGAECEERIAVAEDSDPRALQIARDYLARLHRDDIEPRVQAAIAKAREAGQWAIDEDGAEAPAGPGSEQYNADMEYVVAVARVVADLLFDELKRQGADDRAIAGVQSETHCPGADW